MESQVSSYFSSLNLKALLVAESILAVKNEEETNQTFGRLE